MESSNQRSETGASNNSPANSAAGVTVQPRPPRNQRPVHESRQSSEKAREAFTPPKAKEGNNAEGSGENADEPKRLSLAELFGNSDDGEDGETRLNLSDDSPDDPSKPPDSVEAAIKRLGLKKPEDFYAIKVPMPNGAEPLTIGDLKDRVGEVVDLETREAQFDQRRIASEGELLRAQAEMRELMALVPKDKLTPEVLEKVRQKHEATMKKERVATLEHIPEWQDEKRRGEDLQGMIELLGNYGFDENFIATVVDHRALKLLRDYYLMDKRIKKALANVTIPAKKGHKPSQKPSKGAQKPVAHERTRQQPVMDQRTRIAQLFNQSE